LYSLCPFIFFLGGDGGGRGVHGLLDFCFLELKWLPGFAPLGLGSGPRALGSLRLVETNGLRLRVAERPKATKKVSVEKIVEALFLFNPFSKRGFKKHRAWALGPEPSLRLVEMNGPGLGLMGLGLLGVEPLGFGPWA